MGLDLRPGWASQLLPELLPAFAQAVRASPTLCRVPKVPRDATRACMGLGLGLVSSMAVWGGCCPNCPGQPHCAGTYHKIGAKPA